MATNFPVSVPAARSSGAHLAVHPPKVELFDVAAMTNTDPKGFVRAVEEYREEPAALFMARPVDGHPRLAYFQSLLLPELGLRVSKWRAHPGVELDHDFYIDVADIDVTGGDRGAVWRTVDLYLDILVRTGRDQRVLDADELVGALAAGLLDPAAAERAIERTTAAVDGIAAAGHDVDAWLATRNITINWRSL